MSVAGGAELGVSLGQFVPTQGGNEDVVMRVLGSTEPMALDKLGMTERNSREIRAASEKP